MTARAAKAISFESSLLPKFSLSFADFYEYCMDRIELAVVWFQQHPGERRSWVILEPLPGEAHIYLSTEVAVHVQQIHAAEELWHVVQYCEGFCSVVPQPQHPEWEPIATSLSSLLLDPLAHQVISSFDLDLQPFYSDAVTEKARLCADVRLMMRDFARSPRRELRMYWGALLIATSSIMELPPAFLSDVQVLYQGAFPELWGAAEAFAATIRRRGHATPGKQCALLQYMLQEQGLMQYLVLAHGRPRRNGEPLPG